ncbi:hypothetical protein ACWEKT_21140 [Nocardia takedensis]
MSVDRRESGDSAFWQAATLAVPGGLIVGVATFSIVAALGAATSDAGPSRHTVYAIVVSVLAISASAGALRGSVRSRGVAVGFLAAALLVTFVWAATA